MTAEHEERILDASLEEVLGGHYPPDLTAKIIESWEAHPDAIETCEAAVSQPVAAQPASDVLAPPVQSWTEPVPPPLEEEPTVHVAVRSRAVRRSRTGWLLVAAAASLLLAVALGYHLRSGDDSAGGEIADTEPDAHNVVPTSDEEETLPVRIRRREFVERAPEGGRHEPQKSAVYDPIDEPTVVQGHDLGSLPSEPLVAERVKPSSDSEVIAFVNEVLSETWRKNSVTPSPPETDDGWCRRVYVRLAGREPTQDELDRFTDDKSAGKREDLVNRLLASDEYARQWAGIWTDVLLGPEPAGGVGELANRDGLKDFMYQSLRADKGYDKVAHELLVATGAGHPEAEDYNPAANFLLAGATRNAEAATDRVSRVFLGKQSVCTRCHDHPANDGKLGDFWELNAFFRQMKVRRDSQSNITRLIDQDFYGQSGAGKDAEIFYRLPNGRLGMAYPELNGQRLPHSGLLDDVNRREELAKLIVASHDFRRAVVNRLWARLIGYGFTRPVDDMGLHNPPSHPKLLTRLSDQLAAHDFDLDGLVRWIVLSDAFGLSGRRTPESWMDAPETGGKPLFARYYGEREKSPEVYRSLMLAVNSKPAGLSITPVTLAQRSWSQPQTGQLQIIDTRASNVFAGTGWLPGLSKSDIRSEQKVEHLFLSALNRKPTRRELIAAKLVLADQSDDTVALQEIWNTLLAAAEQSGK